MPSASILRLSTLHFHPEEDEEALERSAEIGGSSGYLLPAGSEGNLPAFVRHLSPQTQKIFAAARRGGHDYVLFDRDAPKQPGLPDFETAWQEYGSESEYRVHLTMTYQASTPDEAVQKLADDLEGGSLVAGVQSLNASEERYLPVPTPNTTDTDE